MEVFKLETFHTHVHMCLQPALVTNTSARIIRENWLKCRKYHQFRHKNEQK